MARFATPCGGHLRFCAARDRHQTMHLLCWPWRWAIRHLGCCSPVTSNRPRFVVGFVPEQGLGIAVKFADGASRAKMGVFATLLGRLALVDAAEALAQAVEGEIRDSNGNPVGSVVATLPA